MEFVDWAELVAGIALMAVGVTVLAAPRRFFIRENDPNGFRPEAVEYDSAKGRGLRRLAPFYVAIGLLFIVMAFL
ncbi:MAG: hypothetical protein CMN74_07620 [Sphingorhabdus sp.]|nr:hypothetical protein [Sphingorhabdus sp.]|tara:strand:- start:1126 stop:1350 length:225 start_codon:yes stop_codon:yes gene_type:complete